MSRAGAAATAWLLLCFGIFAAPARGAAGRAECQSVRSKILGRAVPYCILLPPSYDEQKTRRYPILYFLHGLGDNEQMFLHSGGWNLIEDLWEQHELGEFLIVTPAGGASFYVNSRDGKQRYEDFFLREFLPATEGRYRTEAGRGKRGVAGFSMGGYGALRLAFLHPEVFGSVSVHSAALMEKLPNVSVGGSALSPRMRLLGDVFGSPPDRVFWDRNNPLTLARTGQIAGLKIYFDCGAEDGYGFNEGAEQLDAILASRHIPHEFHIYPGGHDWSYFAEHLPASVEFEARAFGVAAGAR
ncbi:MAG: alpha/beta hydrolase family protein [Candidatus Acidiferrales bacterium]